MPQGIDNISGYDIVPEMFGDNTNISSRMNDHFRGLINLTMRFPNIIEMNQRNIRVLGESPTKFSLQFISGPGWFNYNGKPVHFLESDNNIILIYDGRPLASIGYMIIDDGIFIHQIQGVFYDKLGRGHKRNKTYYPDLQSLNWRDTLVDSVELVGNALGKKFVYIQAAVDNSSLGGRTEVAEKSYDDTADRLGYIDIVGIELDIPRQTKDHRWLKMPKYTHAYRKKL